MLTREQVEQIIDHYEVTLSKLCGSDGVDASDLLKGDAALRAGLALKNEENNSLLAQLIELRAEVERLTRQLTAMTRERGEAQSYLATSNEMLKRHQSESQNRLRRLVACEEKLAAMTQEREVWKARYNKTISLSSTDVHTLENQLAASEARVKELEKTATRYFTFTRVNQEDITP